MDPLFKAFIQSVVQLSFHTQAVTLEIEHARIYHEGDIKALDSYFDYDVDKGEAVIEIRFNCLSHEPQTIHSRILMNDLLDTWNKELSRIDGAQPGAVW
jgi:hypothetical protein